ncbi:MAG TPA: SDR family NAD(P)-dependent oxidoreductase [Thermomicrobiales bacterium]|nr:SDR family NAD(P)-dependent oxidoreductase [Thermomicrobiales bacterium]
MREFAGKVAVVTGAAGGIGRALADRCAREGMRVVLADVAEAPLAAAERELRATGAMALAVPTDVSRAADVEALAERTLDAFGGVHLLCNNAGFGGGGRIWEATLADWERVVGVTLFGVVHGVRTFVPLMLRQGEAAHVVNTASLAGLVSYHTSGLYQVTKHAVVALSETLHHELAQAGASVKVSVLCPGWVETAMTARIRPLLEPPQHGGDATPGALDETARRAWTRLAREGIGPERVADLVFAAIRDEQFYILPHPEHNAIIQQRTDAILRGYDPPNAFALLAAEQDKGRV